MGLKEAKRKVFWSLLGEMGHIVMFDEYAWSYSGVYVKHTLQKQCDSTFNCTKNDEVKF